MRMNGRLSYDVFETGAGWIGVVASAAGAVRSTMPAGSPDRCAIELGPDLDGAAHDPAAVAGFARALGDFVSGRSLDLSGVAIDFETAPAFSRRAWEACRTIPPGQTRTYAWLADRAGRAGAARAAGQAMARNRMPFLVPCHRVVASDGGLGGYGGGSRALEFKRWLLEREAGGEAGVGPPGWGRSRGVVGPAR